MRLCLNIKKLRGQFKQREAIKLIFKFGEESRVETELSQFRSGCILFMEKHYLHVPQRQNVPFVEIQVQDQSKNIISLITVFYVKFKQFTKIDLSNKKVHCTLHYELTEGLQTPKTPNQTQLTQTKQAYAQEIDRLKVFQFGLIVINFSQRIDILIYLWKKIKYFYLWKNPTLTMLVTILLTLLIYYIKFSIFIGGALLYFCKDMILKKFERIHKYDVVKGRILFPEENALFIQHLLHGYTKVYDSITQTFFNHDKTFLINIIQLVCKMGLLNIFMLYFFDFQYILIISLWVSVIMFSPAKQIITQHTKQFVVNLLGEYFRIVDKVSSGISDAIKKSFIIPENQHIREFYYYEYESWSVFEGWTKQKQRLSDESFECTALAKTISPEGWAWTTEWKIDCDGDVDEEGFQYLGKFSESYSSTANLSTRRRRKWKRLCIQNPYR